MRFSVIVPIYKVEKYINKCIHSILSQDFGDFELILIDDGSPDQCPEICDEFAGKDMRVHVIHQKNGGLVSARQAGALAAAGEYIICIDGDDWVDPGYFTAVDGIISKYQTDMVALGCFVERIQHNGYQKRMGLPGNCGLRKLNGIERPSLLLIQELMGSLCCKVYKREIYVPAQLKVDKKITLYEDYLCTLACLLDTESIYISEDAYYRYRNNSTSMTHTFSLDQFQNLERTVAWIESIVGHGKPMITEGIDRFIMHQFHAILIRGYRYADHGMVRKILECKSAGRMLSRVRRLSFHQLKWKASVKLLLLKNEWWKAHFILFKIHALLMAVWDCFDFCFVGAWNNRNSDKVV